ncbi:MAG: hypothetical protein C6P37_01225 [Caldibacillus debilis]|uniref:Uncharacterized protein n=1 Tax=Caldibacillus debilis TaxID=301148 RepID=A0A3E0K8X3_9BACI|nr:MAG: hypothetical protein C6P37_01225 [Caldibacillus debilis]
MKNSFHGIFRHPAGTRALWPEKDRFAAKIFRRFRRSGKAETAEGRPPIGTRQSGWSFRHLSFSGWGASRFRFMELFI